MNESTSIEVHKTFVVAFVAQFSPTLIKKEKKKGKKKEKKKKRKQISIHLYELLFTKKQNRR